MPKLHSLDVIIRSEINGGYRMKVSDLGLGIYVDGFRATKSKRNASGWWIQPPSTYKKQSGEYIQCPEYDKSNSYWLEIEQACIECVEEYERNGDEGLSEADLQAIDQLYGENDETPE